MSFCWCTVHVKDIDASIKFYEEIVGLKVAQRFGAGAMEIAFLGSGETKLELIGGGGGEVYQGQGISIGFTVDDLDAQLKFVKEKGIAIYREPMSPNPKTRFFFVQDPDGLSVQFVELK